MTINVSTENSKIKVNINSKQKLYLHSGDYEFTSSKIYALVGEPNGNGYALACLLSGMANLGKNQVKVDGVLLDEYKLKRISCFIGSGRQGFFKNNFTVKQQIIRSLDQVSNPQSFDEIMDKFWLTPERINRKLAYTGNEHWRASIAIAYAEKKRIYCTPFINEQIWDNYLQLQLERWIRMLRDEDCVVFLPVDGTSKFFDIVDEIIEFQ